MDCTTVKALTEELKALLVKFAEDHNLELSATGASYTDASFMPKITFTEKASDGSIKISSVLAAKVNWELYRMGLPDLKSEDVIGKKFMLSTGSVATVVDFQAKGKYHWIVRKEDGKVVRCLNEHMGSFRRPVEA